VHKKKTHYAVFDFSFKSYVWSAIVSANFLTIVRKQIIVSQQRAYTAASWVSSVAAERLFVSHFNLLNAKT
jgi:hypothetical protein